MIRLAPCPRLESDRGAFSQVEWGAPLLIDFDGLEEKGELAKYPRVD
jgi:hypothetical protein